jgi:4a-hydroxytetrahydrobiopterin dehydratase
VERKADHMHKPDRKNSHKERIFSLPQNKIDFGYQKEQQDRVPKEQKGALNREVEESSLLTANKARESLKNLDGWQLTDDHKMIYREFILQDFMAAVDLIDRIALIAEDEKHHPDIHLTQYRNLRVALTTHDVGGLSEKDFTVALKIKDLPILFHQHNNGVVIDQQSQSKKKTGKEEAVKKNNPIQKPRYEQKKVQPKQRKIISPVLKKGKNVKTHSSSKQGRAN